MSTKNREVWILAATIIASAMAFLDGTVVNIAIPTIQAGFNASFGAMLWVVNAFPLVLASLLLASGALSDLYGRKRIFALGIFIFTLASLLCGLSQSVLLLIVFRGLQGLGAAMMIPGSLAIINVAIPPERRGRAIGLWSGFAGGIAALGPFAGGWLVEHFSWHSIFYINIPLGIAALALAYFFIEESRNTNAKGLDVWGTLCILAGLSGISYALMSAPADGWGNGWIVLSFAVGILALIAFYFVEKRASEPLIPFSIFKTRIVLLSNLVTLFLYFALNGLIFFLVLNLQQVQGLSPVAAGLGLLPSILAITFLSGYGGSIADTYGPRIPMIVGPLIVALGMALLIIPGTHANYFTGFMPGLILFGLGMSAVIAPLTKSALAVDAEHAGSASGVNNAVSRTAALLAIAILGSVSAIIFTHSLAQRIEAVPIESAQRQEIMANSDKMAGMEIPADFSADQKQAAENAVKDSFVYAFRIVVGICALLALISSTLFYFFL